MLNRSSIQYSQSSDTAIDTESLGQNESKKMKKSISIIDAICIVFGTIVGSGIFKGVQEPYGIFESNDLAFVLLFWLFFGFISICGGLCYAELGTRIPQSGGDRAYLKKIFNEKISTVFILFFVFIIKTLTLAGLSITTATYFLRIFVADPDKYWLTLRGIAAVLLLISLIIINFSKKAATNTGVVTTILKTVAILIIIGSGIYFMSQGKTEEWNPPFKLVGFSPKQLGIAMLATFWAFDGGNTLGLVAGDMKNPSRDLPIAIISGMGVVAVLYSLTVISYPAIVGFTLAKTSTAVAYECAKIIFGSFAPIMSVLICSSAFGSATSTLFSVSSACCSAGITGQLPRIFSVVSRKNRTPIIASLVIFIISTFLMMLDFNAILGYVSFTSLIFYSIIYLGLWVIKIRTRNDDNKEIFKVPFVLIVPVQIACIGMIFLSFIVQTYGCLVLLFILIFLYGLQHLKIRKDNKFRIKVEKTQECIIKYLEQKFNFVTADLSDIS